MDDMDTMDEMDPMETIDAGKGRGAGEQVAALGRGGEMDDRTI